MQLRHHQIAIRPHGNLALPEEVGKAQEARFRASAVLPQPGHHLGMPGGALGIDPAVAAGTREIAVGEILKQRAAHRSRRTSLARTIE